MNFLNLFILLSFNYFKKHRFKIIFAILGMSTGIAIYVTTGIYKDTIYHDVKEKEKIVQQTEKWIIRSQNGRIAENSIQDLAKLGIFKKLYPKSETFEYIFSGNKSPRLVKIVGVDLLNLFNRQRRETLQIDEDRFPVLASNYFKKGETYSFKKPSISKKIYISNVVPESPSEFPIIITDISIFQTLFKDRGFIDELEVELISDISLKSIQKKIDSIDDDLVIIQQNKNLESKQSLSDAFLVNLQFFSVIALIISILLIYQFYRFILIEREKDFAKLKSIGMSNRSIFSLLFTELVLIGIICGLCGLFTGLLVSKISLRFIVSTINNFYYNVDSTSIMLTLRLAAVSIMIGISGCLLAGIHPVLRFLGDMGNVKSATKIRKLKSNRYYGYLFGLGILLLVSIFYILNTGVSLQPSLLSFLSVTSFSAGVLFVLPYVLKGIGNFILKLNFLSPLKSKSSISFIDQTLVRQCFFVLSQGILIGFVISLVLFIASFRQTITNWIVQVTPADIYIQSSLNTIQQPYPVSNDVFKYVISLPYVKKYDYISRYKYSYENIPLQVRASSLVILKEENRLRFKSLAKPISEVNKDWVFVSEPFEKRYGKSTGDKLTINGDRSSGTFEIMGVFYDYVSEKGTILIDTDTAKKLFDREDIHGITFYDLPDDMLIRLERDIHERFPGENLIINTKKDLREATLKTFDRTFYIVWFLAILASLISVVTLINSTSMVFLERLFEFSQLRAIGASTRELFSLLWSQMAILSLYSIIMAFLCSLGFINILDNINWAFFGWSIELVFDWKPYVVSFVLLFILTYLTIRIPFSGMVNKMRLYGLRDE